MSENDENPAKNGYPTKSDNPENAISNVYYTMSSLKDSAIQYVVEGPIERVSQIHNYLKDKFSYVGSSAVGGVQTRVSMLYYYKSTTFKKQVLTKVKLLFKNRNFDYEI